MPTEPAQGVARDIGQPAPERRELRPIRDDQQQTLAERQLHQVIDQLQGRGVDPMHVLEQDEQSLLPGQPDDVPTEGVDGSLLAPLRGQVKGRMPLA